MANAGRNPKRARKKNRRNARRDEWRRVVAKRRRQRWGVFLGSLAVVGVGLLIATVAFKQDESPPLASASPAVPGLKVPVACGGKVPPAASVEKKQFSKPKNMKLNPDRAYIWKLETSCGDIEIEFDLERAPKTANSVYFLTKQGFYDGTVFHRVAPELTVVQGGDPEGSGQGGPGYDVVEPPPEKLKYEKGVVAMAKGGADPPGTSGSQFFIVYGKDAEVLPPDYAILGEVVDGMDVVKKMSKLAEADGPPSEWPYIEKATALLKVGARTGE